MGAAIKSIWSHLIICKNIIIYSIGIYGKNKWFAGLFITMIIWHHADYLLQAKWWGWDTWWQLSSSGIKWPMIVDWIVPKDSWHLVQNIRSWLTGIAAIITAVIASIPLITRVHKWYHYAAMIIIWMVIYSTSRAIGFSLPKMFNL